MPRALESPTAAISNLATALVGYRGERAWQRNHPVPDPILATGIPGEPLVRPGEPFARLSIPRIGLDVVVIEGTREEDLLKAPGHLAGSALPGGPDNCIIAGHRDLHFRRLGRLGAGDLIRLEAGGRGVEYRVEGTRVVGADDTAVLARTDEPLLTLVTCYPFHYVGPAPRRFVVQARLIAPDSPGSVR